MGAFFAIIAIVFGLPILYAIGWIIIATVYGTKEGAVPKLRELRAKKAQERLLSHPNEMAISIDQTLCNDMLDFFYDRVRFYCDNDAPVGDMEEYQVSSGAFVKHRQAHNSLGNKLVIATLHYYYGEQMKNCYGIPIYGPIPRHDDISLINLVKAYQTMSPDEYLCWIEPHFSCRPYPETDAEIIYAYNKLLESARIAADLRSVQLACYLHWMRYEPVIIGLDSSHVPRNNPSFADDLYNKYGVRPVKVKTLYDYKMQVLRKRLREAGIAGAQTYMQSGGISQVDYTKT